MQNERGKDKSISTPESEVDKPDAGDEKLDAGDAKQAPASNPALRGFYKKEGSKTSSTTPDAKGSLKLFYDSIANCNTEKDSEMARVITILLEDEGESGNRLRNYIATLASIAQESNRKTINKKLVNCLKEILTLTYFDFGIDLRMLKMELCIAGSLAKEYATPYSDVDCFLIFDDTVSEETKKQLKEIFQKVHVIATILFFHTHQFCMDPMGVSLLRLNGTVDELMRYVKEMDLDFMELKFTDSNLKQIGNITASILNAKTLDNAPNLLNILQDQIKAAIQDIYKEGFDRFCFQRMITEFHGPKLDDKKVDQINIKESLIRPLDCILQGFREKAKWSLNEFDDPLYLLDELYKRKMITEEAKYLMQKLVTEIYELRVHQHKKAKKESDLIPRTPAIDVLLTYVGQLRASMEKYLKKKNPEKFELVQKYLSGPGEKPKDMPKNIPKIQVPKSESSFRSLFGK